jgi:hypothetical protein
MTLSQIRAWGLIVFFLAAVAIHNIALISRQPAAELALKMRVTVTPQRANVSRPVSRARDRQASIPDMALTTPSK